MIILHYSIEIIFIFAIFINALLFIPQALKIIKEKTALGVSLLTFLGFLLIQVAIILHGIITHDYLLIIGYLLSMLTCGAVVILIIIYRERRPFISNNNIGLQEIINKLPGHIYWKNKKGVCLGCNDNNWKDFGLKSKYDFIGKTDYDVFPKMEADKLTEIDQEIIRTGRPKIVEEANVIEGKKILFLSHKIPLRNHHNQIVGIMGVSLDVTDVRKKQIERLEILENIIALMPGHVYWVNREGVYLGCNDNQAKSAGLSSRKEIVGKKNKDLPWNFNAGALPETLDKVNYEVMTTGHTVMVEEPALLRDGTEALFLSNKAPLRNANGEVVGMVGISIDITENRKIKNELVDLQHKLEGMTLVSASIAHELRTPLATISMNAEGLKTVLSDLIYAYQLAEREALPIRKINPRYVDDLEESPILIEREARAAFTVIDMLLTNLKAVPSGAFTRFSLSQCIKKSLSRYPFKSDQKKLIHWQKSEDFLIEGPEELITHVLFNLIKNALYYIAKASRGDITLLLVKGEQYNSLVFKDTGTGIAKEQLPFIFDRFFSRTPHGAGIGLTFCKMVMESLDGSIVCESIEEEYTQFTLYFPVIKEGQEHEAN